MLYLSSSLLAFSVRVEMRISPFRSLLTAITYVVILCNSWALIVIISIYIFFFFSFSLSFLSLITIFSSLRFCSVCSSGLRSVVLRICIRGTANTAIWLYVGAVCFGGIFSCFLISSVFLSICVIGFVVAIGFDASKNASIVCF